MPWMAQVADGVTFLACNVGPSGGLSCLLPAAYFMAPAKAFSLHEQAGSRAAGDDMQPHTQTHTHAYKHVLCIETIPWRHEQLCSWFACQRAD